MPIVKCGIWAMASDLHETAVAPLAAWPTVDPYLVWALRTNFWNMPTDDGAVPLILDGSGVTDLDALKKKLASQFAGSIHMPGLTGDAVQFTAHVARAALASVLAFLNTARVRWELGLPFRSPMGLPTGFARLVNRSTPR